MHKVSNSGNTFVGTSTERANNFSTSPQDLEGLFFYETDTGRFLRVIQREWVELGGGSDHYVKDTATAAITDVVTLEHATYNTPANGFGTGLSFKGDTSSTFTNISATLGKLAFYWRNASSTTRSAGIKLFLNSYNGEQLIGVINGSTGTYVEGNARGKGSIDLQQARSLDTDIASGEDSLLLLGRFNTASGDGSGIIGGNNNVANGDDSYTIASQGSGNGGIYSVILGGQYADIDNGTRRAIILGGEYNQADSHDSLAGGVSAKATRRRSQFFASGSFSTRGDVQRSNSVLWKEVTHSTTNWYTLYSDGISHPFRIESGQVMTIEIAVTGTDSTQTNTFSYLVNAHLKNNGSVSVPAFNVTTIYESIATFDVQVVAGTDAMNLQVRDSAGGGNTIRWGASVRNIEIIY